MSGLQTVCVTLCYTCIAVSIISLLVPQKRTRRVMGFVIGLFFISTMTSAVAEQVDQIQLSEIEQEEITIPEYSEEDFDAASKAVMARFYQSKPYCELKELYYPGDEETDRQDRYAADSEPGAIANVSHEESMVLQGKYVTGDEGKVSPALNPNAVYPDWTWILCRSQDGGWEVRDEGY